MATAVLAQPVSASAAERNWSVYGNVAGGMRIGHAKADKRVYCKQALALRNKVQTAKYTQAVEEWDSGSDSDSEVSIDEEDLMW